MSDPMTVNVMSHRDHITDYWGRLCLTFDSQCYVHRDHNTQIMYYTVCYFTGIFYAVLRQISVLFIDNKDSVLCILYHIKDY